MEVFEIDGRLIQLETVSDISDDGVVAECWDITAGVGQGLLFSVFERPNGLVLRSEMNDLPVNLLLRVLAELGHEG